MTTADYDVVVIGAGIHGAGVAQAAAADGYRVLVLEQTGIASATSSRSSKLIHGGLRYLEHGELSLVWECLRERERLLQLAPSLVQRRRFHIPVYNDTRRRPWQLRAGLSLYALLAGMGTDARFRRLPRREWPTLDGLRTDGLQGVFQYWDAQTDDVLLTRAVMASACTLGAELRIPASLHEAEVGSDGIRIAFDSEQGRQTGRCRTLVNATGPWINRTAARITPAQPMLEIDLVQGTHLILDTPLRRGIYYLEVPRDGRAVFAMPWHDKLLLGTTETPFTGSDPASVAPLPQEREYLLETLTHYFPGLPHREIGAFAGLRVLPKDRRRPFERAREIMLMAHPAREPRCVSVYGGKLTSYRADAEKIMALLRPVLPARKPVADTRTLPLPPPQPGGV